MLGLNWFPAAFACAILGGLSALLYGHFVPAARWHFMYTITVVANVIGGLNYYEII